MANVSFSYGTRTAYDAIGTKSSDVVYFCTDTYEIFKGTIKISDVILSDAASTAAISSPIEGKFYYLTALDTFYYYKGSSTFIAIGGAGSGGDVTGPSSSVDGNVTLFNGTTGKIIKALANGTTGQFLKMGASGPEWGSESWTANTQANDGYVTAGGSNASKVWKTDESGNPAWRADEDTTYSDATTSVHGLMSATDKTKLDGVETGAQANVIEGIKRFSTEAAVTVTSKIAYLENYMVYKGEIAGGSTGAYGALTPAAYTGDVYSISASGKVNGIDVEVGDLLICYTSTYAATESSYTLMDSYWLYIQNNVVGPMSYRGSLAGGSTGAYGALTPAAEAGHVYIISVAGQIDGIDVEVGDLLICNTNSTDAATSETYATVALNWSVIQTNIDGAVTTAAVLTSGQLVIGNGDGTVTILSAGTNGYVLKMVSGTPTWSAEQTIPNGFSKVAVSGQSDVDADSTTDTLTLANGTDITITTNSTTDTITVSLSTQSTTPNTSNASPAYGGTFTVIDGVTVSNGRLTAYNTKTVTLPTLEWGTF